MTVFIGVLAAILMLAATLLGGRRAQLALISIVALSVAGSTAWSRAQPVVRKADSAVITVNGPLMQYDNWEFQTAPIDLDASPNWFGNTRPMLITPQEVKRQHLLLHCDINGQVRRLTARLAAGQTLVTMSKNVEPRGGEIPVELSTDSPMWGLARQSYVTPAVRVLGQAMHQDDIDHQLWPGIVLERSTP
jgi:hypothetical protein